MSDERNREIAELRRRLAELEQQDGTGPAVAPRSTPDSPSAKLLRYGGIALLVLVGAFAMWLSSNQSKKPTPPAFAESTPSSEPLTPEQWAEIDKRRQENDALRQEAETARLAAITPWTYRDDVDPMSDKLTRWACTTSTNRAMLDRPYEPVSADLCLRQSPRYGLDAIVQLNGDGQILCRSYDGCTLKIRFGDGAQQSFSGASAADGSSNVVFISNASRFITAAKSAPTTKIQLTFYRAGDQVLEFNTEKLEWPRPAK